MGEMSTKSTRAKENAASHLVKMREVVEATVCQDFGGSDDRTLPLKVQRSTFNVQRSSVRLFPDAIHSVILVFSITIEYYRCHREVEATSSCSRKAGKDRE
jgi:hypothetical protein